MRRAAAGALCAALLGGMAAAQDLPALYDVTGVASDDVLNVRDAPQASANRIGTLAPDSAGIEVIATQGGWARVNTAERSGWASLSFLVRQPGQWGDGLPAPQSCFGTEPFWSLDLTEGEATFDVPDAGTQTGPITLRIAATGRPDRYAFAAEMAEGRAVFVMGRTECSDGMSDRLYGLSADVLIGDVMYSGCCSVAPVR